MTVHGFFRWLRSLRALNALRDSVEVRGAEAHVTAARLDALETQSTVSQQVLEQRARELRGLAAEFATMASGHSNVMADVRSIASRLAEVGADLAAIAQRADEDRAQSLAVRDGVRTEITEIVSRLTALDEQAVTQVEASRDRDARIESTRTRLAALDSQATAQSEASRERDARIESMRARLAEIAPAFPSVAGLSADASAGWFHAAVEFNFRGAVDEIRRRLAVYVPYLAHIPADARTLPALDLGCGRGEWLDVLQGVGIAAIGVDANPVSVDRCRARNLQVDLEDAIAWLERRPDRSACLVSAFHVIEHLPLESTLRMLLEARRVLVEGGVLMLETPNPDNLAVGANAFHLDPTHRHPIPMPLLRVMVDFARFEAIETFALQPDDALRSVAVAERWPETLANLLAGPRDTGLVARAPAAPAAASSQAA